MRNCKNIILITIIFAGCRKPYNPPAITSPAGHLVVEGVINSGSDSTTITLSRTVNVSSANTANPVLHATVAVQSDQNVSYPLTETTNGNYVSAGLNLDNSHTYRLSIKTTNNEQYQSDLVHVLVTPPFDSVGFNILSAPADTGVQIYANAHDPTNTVKYYRWDYSEAWEFHSKSISYWISNGTTLVLRTQAQDVSTCYTNDVSSDIVLGSTAKLKQAVIYQNPIVFISSHSEKIENEYSILLRQYALTADAYNFWVSLKKNTEQLGSIFDAQPSQLTGNIHCITNPSEPVIGYVSVSTVPSKRIFIASSQLPGWVTTYPYSCSVGDTLRTYTERWFQYLVVDSSVNLDAGPPPLPGGGLPFHFLYTSRQCADCTIRGTITPPPFWK
jgi:hypothetical protein